MTNSAPRMEGFKDEKTTEGKREIMNLARPSAERAQRVGADTKGKKVFREKERNREKKS